MNVYIRELARELSYQNCQIDIFTRRTNRHLPMVVALFPNVRVIHIEAGPVAPVHKNDLYQYTPTFARRVDEFRRRESMRYDVLHSHYWLSGVAAMRLACYWNIPHITMFHTLGRLKQQANPDAPEPAVRLEMEQRLIHDVDRIIAATVDERTQMLRSCGANVGKIEIVPCGVDLTLFAPHDRQKVRAQLGFAPSRPILLFAGRLDPFKGPDLLLRAASLMQNKAAQIVIAGGNPTGDSDLHSLQDLAQDLEIADRVRFLGARPREEMPLLYSAADVTVVPSYHESFGLAAVESLACGTPVVATRAGGLTTVVRHEKTGFLVPRSPGFFAERLDTLLSDAPLYARMSVAARASVTQYGWTNIARRMLSVYDELVREGRYLVAL